MSKISVIIPVYNAAKFVEFTLNSLLNQTFTDFEIIAINDGSTDNSADILAKYAQKDKRIRIINQENKGLSGARNSGIAAATGEYFYFCDADDVCHPQLLEFLLRAAETEKADMAICKFQTVTDNANITHQVYNFPDKYEVIDHPIEYFCTHKKNYGVTVWTKLYKASALDGLTFKKEFTIAEDVYFNLHMANRIKKAVFLPVPLYYYYLSEGSVSRKGLAVRNLEQHIMFYELVHKDFSAQPKIRALIQKYICNRSYFEFIKYICSLPDNEEFVAYWQKNIKRLHAEGVLSSAGLSLKKRFVLWRFLHKNEHIITNLFCQLKKKNKYLLFSILGIPFLKIRDKGWVKEFYLLSFIPIYFHFELKIDFQFKLSFIILSLLPNKIFKRKTSAEYEIESNLKKDNFANFNIDNKVLLTELKNIGEFTFIPDPGNMGDCLLAKATYDFFDDNHLPYQVYQKGYPQNVVYGGGGIWVKSIYANSYQAFLDIFEHAQKIIILPSSIYDCPKLVNVLDERFVVFCREKQSYDYLVSQNTKAKIILDHDMAFRLNSKALACKYKINFKKIELIASMLSVFQKKNRRINFLRKDVEGMNLYPSDYDLSDAYGSDMRNINDSNFGAKLMLSAVDYFDTIITDRLHVGIASALMSKEVYLLDNNYKKVSSVYKQSLSQCPNVHLCTEYPKEVLSAHNSTNNLQIMMESYRNGKN